MTGPPTLLQNCSQTGILKPHLPIIPQVLQSNPQELICSVLELTARFSRDHDSQSYGEIARWSIMLRIANATVDLETIESLCLLSYSAFIDGDMHLGQFYLGLGFQLCRSAKLDRLSTPRNRNPVVEREKRVFWSLQSLEQFYGEQRGILRTATEAWRPYYLSHSADTEFPCDLTGAFTVSDIGIWTLSVHFGWVWGRVREYVTECSQNKLIEPWRLDSTYAKVLADLTEIENKAPLCHRYHIVKFNERRPDEVQEDRDYWMPWLKLQFTWHSILTMINHPFLYIVASQCHPNLAIPNTFWRKSSEMVLLHATWIVRTIDMIHEKDVRLLDPFFGHATAIAATVHLYFCCATDLRLRQKSKVDFAKCKRFLRGFASFSSACKRLSRLLDKMTRIALVSENTDEEWAPSRIHLSVSLMWAILQFDVSSSEVMPSPEETLLPTSSSTLNGTAEETERSPTLEISVTAAPPPVITDPSRGHDASLPPYKATSTSPDLPRSGDMRDTVVPSPESFTLNKPWLWADPSGYANIEDVDHFPPDLTAGNGPEGFSTWWNFGYF
ncbi:hypothetical protein PISL3812_06029 [Talaromyces islandicus]|uniref:Xylanolytic transcriptional activator regulatory domain-containing protein n=1 Tax=Talaromyces islandicus TaxID=28573 RepID=A0A0U1M0A8_TALIS|nr:hypothetical protein PISL3812_06029 [Talaromyces islandicus]